MMPKTTRHSLKLLTKSVLNKLENRKFIEINPATRNELQEEFCKYLSRSIITDEDLTERVRAEISSHSQDISDKNITETSAFQSRKNALKAQLGENELHGFFFQQPLRSVAMSVSKYLLDSSLVDEVYESDEAILKLVLDTLQNFDENKIA